MIEDPLGYFFDKFEKILMTQERLAGFMLMEKGPVKLPVQTAIEILRMNVSALELTVDAINISYKLDDYTKDKLLMLCSEALSWTALIFPALDVSSLFIGHLEVGNIPLVELIRNASENIGLRDLEDTHRQLQDAVKVLKRELDLITKSYNRIV